MLTAITRAVSPAIDRCELTNIDRLPINLERANIQHAEYEQTLRDLGLDVHSLPADPELPDSVFVEDAAIVLDEIAVITLPGADSRKPEINSIARTLAPYRNLVNIKAPGTLDGGDVLKVGKTIFVGLSERSNSSAIRQLENLLDPFGYKVNGVPVRGCLHLKSAVTQVEENCLVINPAWADKVYFPGLKFIDVHPSEPYAANALLIGTRLIYQPAFSKTLANLETAGMKPVLVDQSELGKAEGGLTCCSLIFKT
jgi:dimethylargininase